jgi:serine protease Do
MNQEVIAESEQGYLGIQGKDITDEYAEGFNMPKGVYVVKIVDDSPADSCGLQAGDIITKFADRDISSMENLQSILTNKKAGEEVEMVVERSNEKGDYEEVTLTVTLGAKKDMPESEQTSTEEATESTEENAEDEFGGEEYYTYPDQDIYDEFNGFFNR